MECSCHRWLINRGIGRRFQECHDRIGDGIGGAPGQVMTGAFDQPQAGIRQGAGEPAGGIEGNQAS
jgi:hypothetical protein